MREAVNVHTLGALAAPAKAAPKKRRSKLSSKLSPREQATLSANSHMTLGALARGKMGL